MRCTVAVAALALAAAAPAPARADAPGPAPKIAYQHFTLGNGLEVYVIEDHRAPTVDEVLWFRVGSKDEVLHRTGFAHLFEHLMFKGSAHLPDGEMDQLLEAGGGWSNAFTSSDMTVYQNVAASNFLATMLWIDADRLAGLVDTLDQPKLDNQRDVVLNERRQSYENRPYGNAELMIHDALWPVGHGYHWDTIGDPADLHAAQLGDVAAFFRTYYVPNNATMVIAGDIQAADAKRLVTQYFGWIPRGAEPARPRYATPAPLAHAVELAATDTVTVPRVFIAWRAPAQFSADEPALDLAAAILGDGNSSRLYQRLVYDEKIAQDVSAAQDSQELGGAFEITATAKPGVDPKRLIAEITAEVATLASTPPRAVEVERAQAAHEASFLGGLEPMLQRAIALARYAVQAHDADYFGKDLARYRATSGAAITAAAARYLAPTARVVLTISPGAKAMK